MELSNPKTSDKKLFCLARKIWVAATPEECLRQKVLDFMLGAGGYPRGLIALEAPIDKNNAARRADIIAYYRGENDGLSPLMVIECKAVKLTPLMLQQVGGYNHYLSAPFVALSAPQESYWGWLDAKTKKYLFQFGFPTFPELMKLLKSSNHLSSSIDLSK